MKRDLITKKYAMRFSVPARFIIYLFFAGVFLLFFEACSNSPALEATDGQREWAEQTARETIRKIRKGHPRIYLTPERTSELKDQAMTSKGDYLRLLKVRMGASQAALFSLLADDPRLGLDKSRNEYGRVAADALMKAIREDNRTSPDYLAVLYDWANDALTNEEKKAFVEFCRKRLGNRPPIHNEKQHGYRSSPAPQGILAALSFYGDGIDDDYARDLLFYLISESLLDNLAMENVAGNDGGFADGTAYFIYLGGTFFPFLALGIATDTDFFFEHEVLTKMPNHLIYAMLPFTITRVGWTSASRYFATFHDNWTSTPKELGSSFTIFVNELAITAAEYRRRGDLKKSGLYMWFLNEIIGGIPYQAEDPVSFVLMDWGLQPQKPEQIGLPEAEALGWNEETGSIARDRFGKKSGIGWVSMRSKWNDPDATFAIFKSEPFYYHGHMHRDSLSFMIAKGEELVIARAGNYMPWAEGGPLQSQYQGWIHGYNFFTRALSSNGLLIYDPAESFDGWTNHGGQRDTSYWDPTWGRTYNGTANGNYRDIGGLIRFERNEHYVYTAADATRAYNSTAVTSGGNRPKVNLVQREFVYVRSPEEDNDFFVILDRVESVNPEFRKFWLLQLRAKPEFDGSHTIAAGNESGGIHVSRETGMLHVRQERAELWGSVLLPREDNRIVRRIGGWVTTRLLQPLEKDDDGPLDIKVESTDELPDHPVVIITADSPNAEWEVFDKFGIWPKLIHASGEPIGRRICYYCGSKTRRGQKPAMLLNCIRATKSAPGFPMPVGARVIQEFRHIGIEGVDKNKETGRIDYPWGYGLGYNYGDGNQYGLWRVEVSPRNPSTYDNFLNVLQPVIKGKKGLKAELIESEDRDLVGVRAGRWAVLFSRKPEPLREGSYTLSGTGLIRQLLCNLQPGSRYRIKKDGKVLSSVTATKQGTARFETDVDGSSRFEFSTF